MSFGQWPSDYLGVPIDERFNFNPLTYFLYSGVDGCWLDPEDMSTMYQDAAGTIPVTAMEQPVGLWLDKSGNGYHATQSITASRPTLSARYNLLLNSATLSTQSVTTVAAQYTLSFTGTGSVTLSGTATGTLTGTGVNNRVSLSFTPTDGTLTLTVTGSVTLAMLAFGTLTTYQAITTATNYDNSGWSQYVRFDGIDDYLNLPYMGLYANKSASVVVCASLLKKATDANILSERSTSTTNPSYGLVISMAAPDKVTYISRSDGGAAISIATNAAIVNKNTKIISCVDTGTSVKFNINSVSDSITPSIKLGTMTGNRCTIGATYYYPSDAYVSFLKGNTYGLIITKSALSDTDRKRCEQFLASRLTSLGVTLS